MTGTTWKERIAYAARQHADRKAWDAANPELAKVWSEALQEHARRLREGERARYGRERLDALPAHLERCGLFKREVEVLSGPLRTTPASAAAREFWGSEATFLLLCGRTGAGKTVAAASLFPECKLNYLHPELGPVFCWPSTVSLAPRYELAGTLAQASHYGDEAEHHRDRLIRCRLLVVDELGAEVMTDPWRSRLDEIINQRHRAKRKTVLVSNLSKADFKARYGERIARRIREDGMVPDLHEGKP